jgi:hypothetical protein
VIQNKSTKGGGPEEDIKVTLGAAYYMKQLGDNIWQNLANHHLRV